MHPRECCPGESGHAARMRHPRRKVHVAGSTAMRRCDLHLEHDVRARTRAADRFLGGAVASMRATVIGVGGLCLGIDSAYDHSREGDVNSQLVFGPDIELKRADDSRGLRDGPPMSATGTVANGPASAASGLAANGAVEGCTLVLFGASGDLTKRMVMPAIFRLARRGLLSPEFRLVGYARTKMTDDEFRALMRKAVLREPKAGDEAGWNDFASRLSYVAADYDDEKLGRCTKTPVGTDHHRFRGVTDDPQFFEPRR